MVGKSLVRQRLDTAGLEEIARKGRARGELGEASEIGEEDLRPCAGSGQHRVGGVAQLLERRGEAQRAQGRERDGSRTVRARSRAPRRATDDRRLGEMREIRSFRSMASLRRATACSRFAAPLQPCSWMRPRSSAAATPPAASISWNSGPGGAAELVGEVLDAAGAGRRIAHLGEVRFLQQDELRVAREPAREAVGQSERGGERQHRDRCRRRRGRPRTPPWWRAAGSPTGRVSSSSARRSRPRRRRRAGQARTPPPPAPTAFAARGTWPWSGTGRHRRRGGRRSCGGRRRAGCRPPPAPADRRPRPRARRRAPAPPSRPAAWTTRAVGGRERPAKALRGRDRRSSLRRSARCRSRRAGRRRPPPWRRADRSRSGCRPLRAQCRDACTSAGEDAAGILGLRGQIELDGDAGIEQDAVEHALERSLGGVEAVAVAADRPGEHERQARSRRCRGRAALPRWRRRDRDGRRAAAPARRRRARGRRSVRASGLARVERLDAADRRRSCPPAVSNGAPLSTRIDQLAPVVGLRRGEIAAQGKRFGVDVRHESSARVNGPARRHTICAQRQCHAGAPRPIGHSPDAAGGPSRSIPVVSMRASASRTLTPLIRRSGRDLGERHQHEGALEQAWMRQGQVLLVHGEVVIGEDIDIHRPRPPAPLVLAVASALPLDPQRPVEQLRAATDRSPPPGTD